MLDECKGEKFEEVLVAVSTIVLKRQIRNESLSANSITRGLILGHSIPASQQESRVPLIIAHRASLTTQLRKKKELKSHYSSFRRLLDSKEHELADRARQLKEASQHRSEVDTPGKAAEECKDQLKNHWLGDKKWVDIIVQGHPYARDESLLETSFNKVWSNVRNGTNANATATSGRTLLADLEIRVAGQQARLGRWKKFQEDMKENAASRDVPLRANLNPKQEKGLGLEFRRHQELVPKLNPSLGAQPTQEAARSLPMTTITSEYQNLIASMREELANVGKPKTRGTGRRGESKQAILAPKHGVSVEGTSTLSKSAFEGDSPRSKDHELLEERSSACVPSKIPTKTRRAHHRTTSVLDSCHFDDPLETCNVSPSKESLRIPSTSTSPEQLLLGSTSVDEAGSNVAVLESSQTQYPDDQPSPQKNEEELLAEHILSSIANAEPSPAKSKLSLAERTRRSMAYIQNKDSTSMAPPSMPVLLPPMPESPVLPSPDSETFDGRASLLERTRQSMSLLRTKPRKSLQQPRRSKMFPTNQFETPKKQNLGMINSIKSLTPPEELFSQEADYASVFKSRPKIGLSPTISPARLEEIPSEVEEMELAGNWDSSPVTRAVGRIGGI